jgi:tetratricopeptide (TPR) repeat protein
MIWAAGLLVLACGALHGELGAAEVTLESSAQGRVIQLGTAEEQLSYALNRKRLLRGARGERRLQLRREAVQAYRAVRHYFPRDRQRAAEASYRAGELLRSARENEEAISEFEHARILGLGSVFGARAGLEVGHIERRRGRLNDALAIYAAVEVQAGQLHGEQRDLAAYWAGRVHARMGRPQAAARCYERAAGAGVDPVQRVRSFDAWAESLIDRGDLEGAAGVLEQCRQASRRYASEQTQLGLRVRGALEAMRSVSRLKREIELRRGRSQLRPSTGC